jgi:hypothetical protein
MKLKVEKLGPRATGEPCAGPDDWCVVDEDAAEWERSMNAGGSIADGLVAFGFANREEAEFYACALGRSGGTLGLLCIGLCETEIDALIRIGLLNPRKQNDAIAVTKALYEHLDRTLSGHETDDSSPSAFKSY